MRLIDNTVEGFSGLLASEMPTPGGGSAAALEAALGISLITMVTVITAGKDERRKEVLQHIIEEAERIRRRLLALVDEDTAAYKGIMAVHSMPRNTEEQKRVYYTAMQDALTTAVITPYTVLSAALDGLRLAKQMSSEYYPPTASDLGLAAQSLKTAAQGAELTMLINLNSITDAAFGKKYRYESQIMLDEALLLADDVYAEVRTSLMDRI